MEPQGELTAKRSAMGSSHADKSDGAFSRTGSRSVQVADVAFVDERNETGDVASAVYVAESYRAAGTDADLDTSVAHAHGVDVYRFGGIGPARRTIADRVCF